MTSEQIFSFVDELRRQHRFALGPADYIRVAQLVDWFVAKEKRPVSTATLGVYLAPILCRTPHEQRVFYQHFDNWFTRENPTLSRRDRSHDKGGDPEPAVLPDTITQDPAADAVDEHQRSLRRAGGTFGILLTSTFFVLIAGWYILDTSDPPKQIDVKVIDARLPVRRTGDRIPSTSNETDQVQRQALIRPTPRRPPDYFISDRLFGTGPSFPTQILRTGELILACGIVFFIVIWLITIIQRRQRFFERQFQARDLETDTVYIAEEPRLPFSSDRLHNSLQSLRIPRQVESRKINIRASIKTTIAVAGYPTEEYMIGTTVPEYLLLVQRTSERDHHAGLVDVLTKHLLDEQVYFSRYDYRDDPRRCRVHTAEGSKFRETVLLADLAARYPNHRLLVIGDPRTWFDPLTGSPYDWVYLFESWQVRAILSEVPESSWDQRERIMGELGFLPLPFNSEGIIDFTDHLRSGAETIHSQPRSPVDMARTNRDEETGETLDGYPWLLQTSPRRWLRENKPKDDQVAALLNQIERYLGRLGMFWFEACAVFPRIEIELTLQLGSALTLEIEQRDAQESNTPRAKDVRLTSEKRIFRLTRLPWFRRGSMPDWLRLELIKRLLRRHQLDRVRSVLLSILNTAQKTDMGGMALAIVRRDDEKWRDAFFGAVRNEPENSPLKEYIFLSVMRGDKSTELLFEAPQTIVKLLRRGWNPIEVLGIIAAVLLTAAVVQSRPYWGWMFQPTLEERIQAHEIWNASGGQYGVLAKLEDSELPAIDLEGAYLHAVDFSNSDLRLTILRGAVLTRANLTNANLVGVDLSGADLTGASLKGANLSNANLKDTFLSEADLSNAFLAKANLTNAQLDGADLGDAVLSNTQLTNANLIGVKSVDISQLNFDTCANTPPYNELPTVNIIWRLCPEEAERVAAEEEVMRLAREDAIRVAAEEEAKRLATEEAERVAGEEEAKRLAAEEANRVADENEKQSSLNGKKLNVSNWAEYMDENTIENFAKEYDIEVTFTPYDSVEAIDSKFLAGNSGYDVVAHAATQSVRLIKGGVLHKLNKSKLPNLKHMRPEIMAQIERKWDPGNSYFVPFMWGTHGVTFNKELVLETYPDAPIGSIDLIFDPKHMKELAKCGVSFLDSPSDMIPMALAYLGLQPDSTNSADYKKAEELLQKVRPYIKTFDNYAYQRMPDKEFCVAVTWGPDGLLAIEGAKELGSGIVLDFFLPAIPNLWVDVWVIPEGAENIENAHLFMNYMMRPEVAAADSNYTWYATANKDAIPMIDENVTSSPAAFPTSSQISTMYTLNPLPPKVERVRTRTWTNFKAGK